MINPQDLHLCIQPITTIQPHHHKKKRTKMVRFPKPKPGPVPLITKKKPNPSAPKITPPCTECGKRFWSWKALFGHMRCHPDRPWRGINPPPNIHLRSVNVTTTTEEDEYVAACLLMLANTPPTVSHNNNNIQPTTYAFECSSCKKVFGSHQALGGHRASHKNVKGCFAITKTELDLNGQALGRHKRCHLDKEDGVIVPTAITFRFDSNAPPPLQDDSTCSSSYLDLRLHL